MPPMPGEIMGLYVNQGIRVAECLAELDGQYLFEYEMPNGTTALRLWSGKFRWGWRRISYFDLPQKWIDKLIKDEITWIGTPQQLNRKYMVVIDRVNKKVISVRR
jgi:hypothetical protein